VPRSAAQVQNFKSQFEISDSTVSFDPFHYERRSTPEIELNEHTKCGGEQTVRVVVTRATWDKVAPKIRPKDDVKPERFTKSSTFLSRSDPDASD